MGIWPIFVSLRIQFSSVVQSCPTLCHPMNHSTPGLPVHQQLQEFTQTHIHWVSDAIQPFHPQSSPSPPALNPSQHQSLFLWVNSSHEEYKGLYSKSYGFPVVMYGCESWTTKKAECWRIDAFELWCWRILLGVPCTARRSNRLIVMDPNKQQWIFTGRTYAEAEAPIFWPPDAKSQLIGKRPWCWERSRAEEGVRGWDG